MSNRINSILIIQTAFIGDVILATALIEKLRSFYPQSHIDFLVRKGNEGLLEQHPTLREVLIWDKRNGKIKNLFKLIGIVRQRKYDVVINVHRFASSGLITAFSGSSLTIGFDKNPLSLFFKSKIKHELTVGLHEIERNQKLIESITDVHVAKPRLYPTDVHFKKVQPFKTGRYICLAPTSVWFTKQYPKERWIDFISKLPGEYKVYLLGAPSDRTLCDEILKSKGNIENLAGLLNFLESAALMKDAVMNYVNDSAPMHIASSMNAPVTAIFCSTIPAFGFGPLSHNSHIIETKENLSCKPCGLHGFKACPKTHFKCATTIPTQELLNVLTK